MLHEYGGCQWVSCTISEGSYLCSIPLEDYLECVRSTRSLIELEIAMTQSETSFTIPWSKSASESYARKVESEAVKNPKLLKGGPSEIPEEMKKAAGA